MPTVGVYLKPDEYLVLGKIAANTVPSTTPEEMAQGVLRSYIQGNSRGDRQLADKRRKA
ncbi:MAG: hypothetical protein L3K18_09570 [Thermoplasmata archaeon]|nr:hypothetical protein [Thermoplasmata archaeon]